MTNPVKSRRAVMAELLLLADPAYVSVHPAGFALSVTFDSIADLKSWLERAGLADSELLVSDHRSVRDGRACRTMGAYPTWHGWEFYASATDDLDGGLDAETVDGLTAVAVA